MNTLAVQLTQQGMGAIAVIGVTGPRAADIIAKVAPSHRDCRPGGMCLVHVRTADGESIDQALLLRTADDQFELHLHGGTTVVDMTLAALEQAGAALSSPPSAQSHALCLFRSKQEGEVTLALSHAATMTAARLLSSQLQRDTGLLSWVGHWRAWLTDESHSADLWQLHSAAQWLAERSASLARLLMPPRIAIVGEPNAGKSTLANALLGRPLSITSDLAGTTRDWVDAQVIFSARATSNPDETIEVPVILVDTAGIRETPDALERESIARTHQQIQAADVVIVLLDATTVQPGDEHHVRKQFAGRPVVLAVNKIDTLDDAAKLASMCRHATLVSAKEHKGLELLMQAVLERLDLADVNIQEPFAFNERQHNILTQLSTAQDMPKADVLLQQLESL